MAKTARYPASLSAFISETDRSWIDSMADDSEASISEVVRAAINVAKQHEVDIQQQLQR